MSDENAIDQRKVELIGWTGTVGSLAALLRMKPEQLAPRLARKLEAANRHDD